jgi:hypothetical protein
MKTTKQNTRRSFIDKLVKGFALGTAASLLMPNKIHAGNPDNPIANIYAMWTHGSEGKMEGVFHDGRDQESIGDKMANKFRSALTAGYLRGGPSTRFPGNTISLTGAAAASMASTSGGSLFRIWDSGTKSKPKSGEFWVHYTIPTPSIANNVRCKVSKILVKCASTDANFYIADVELWDANLRLYNKGNLKLWGPDKMHSFPFAGNNNTVRYGLCISLKITGANVTADQLFEISGVGVDLLA